MAETSRQRAWQRRKAELGLCSSCGTAVLPGRERCFRHHVLRLLARHDLRPAKPGQTKNREIALAWLRGVYGGTRYYGSFGDVAVTAFRAYGTFVFNRSKGAAERFVKVALAVERMALKARGETGERAD